MTAIIKESLPPMPPAPSIPKTVPTWAKYTYRLTFGFTTALTIWVGSTSLIPALAKAELMVGFKLLDGLVYSIAQMFGVEGNGASTPPSGD